jgi:hypothetical protein
VVHEPARAHHRQLRFARAGFAQRGRAQRDGGFASGLVVRTSSKTLTPACSTYGTDAFVPGWMEQLRTWPEGMVLHKELKIHQGIVTRIQLKTHSQGQVWVRTSDSTK